MHESFLNVRGLSQIVHAIKGCYASLWTPQAVAYRRKMGLSDDEVAAAVVIMEMVPAVASGVFFSHLIRSLRNRFIQECVLSTTHLLAL